MSARLKNANRRWLSTLLLLCAFAFSPCRHLLTASLAPAVDAPQVTHLPPLKKNSLYAVTVSVKDPEQVVGDTEIAVAVSDARGIVASKTLHAGDLDFYLTLRPRAEGQGTVQWIQKGLGHGVSLDVQCEPIRLMQSNSLKEAVISAQPNQTWQQAQPFELGQTVFGSADERSYIPAPSEDRYQALLKGFHWFTFKHIGSKPMLVFFVIDVLDRDVPVDVDIFQLARKADGATDVAPYREGAFIYQPEATQNFPGLYRFRTRIVKPGETYYLRVAANHPSYTLRTYLYAAPPYKDPRQAVRTGMDFLINMGDSWHMNTPRRGAVALRDTMAHSETHTCIACHPTQFTTRGYLYAVKNGYPVTQRPSLKFLTERLYNNARPLYGYQDTNWVRVIYSARTVSSRIPYLLSLHEQYVSREPPRPGFDQGYANYLKVHYQGVEQLPGNEPDGCAPDISPFEIAFQSYQTFDLMHRRTGDRQWLEQRQRLDRILWTYKPRNVIDLAWKLATLGTIDKTKYRDQIDELVRQLYKLQRANGQWPYQFEKQSKPSDFITFHVLWALAVTGRRPETDAPVLKALQYCLAAQRPEGSWQGDPVYKGFNTPFRDTQFAVMALSELFRGTGGRGWGAAFPKPPANLEGGFLDAFLYAADQHWQTPPEHTLAAARNVLQQSKQPLAREAAAALLGRVADQNAVPVLVRALGDPTKIVQRTAAWALREIAVRRGNGRAELAAALSSSDARVRWGATRLFNQHFRDLTGDDRLLQALLARLDDRVPQARYQAAAGLWRWYYWQVQDEDRRGRILEALTRRMGVEHDPVVRRGLMESVYDLLDENTGYLRAWVKAAAQSGARERIEQGYEAVVRQQSQILARALRQGNTLAREGILNALWDFHVRHMAVPDKKEVQVNLPKVFTEYVAGVPDLHRPGFDYRPYREAAEFHYDVSNGFNQVRIGNDSELIHFYASSGPELEQALIACLANADSKTKINVLKAGHTLSKAGGLEFAQAALNLALDPDPVVREAVRYVYEKGIRGTLNVYSSGTVRPDLANTAARILKEGRDEGLAVLLPLLADLPPDSPWNNETEVIESLRQRLLSGHDSPLYAQMLEAAAAFESLLTDEEIQRRIREGFSSKDATAEVQRASLQIMMKHFLDRPALSERFARVLSGARSPQRAMLLEEMSDVKKVLHRRGQAESALGLDVLALKLSDAEPPKDYLKYEPIYHALLHSLNDRDGNVRAAALDIVAKKKELLEKKEVRQALERLSSAEPTPRLRKLAGALLEGKDTQAAFEDTRLEQLLDYDFFVRRVQPILAAGGPDGKACVVCHSSHAIFKLSGPDYTGQFTEEISKQNYRYALPVVDVSNPEQSLILIKPTRPSDSAGDVSDYLATHNGGQRWTGNEKSDEYRTILQWVRGARLAASH